mmetsp:Transcript_9674/g.13962  ORF Transcript_9674/g.13962 Transcript_9674/m.13962 type:complete len:810 (+) Transcript_9674:152-2581(+)
MTSTVLSPRIQGMEANLCFMGKDCNSPHLPVSDCCKCHQYLHQTCGGNYRHRLVTIDDVEIESVNVFYCRGCDPVLAQEREAAGPPKGGVVQANPNQENCAKPPGLLEMAIEVSPSTGSLLTQRSLFAEEGAVDLTLPAMDVNTSISSIGKEAMALALSSAQVLHGKNHPNDTKDDSTGPPPIGSVEQVSPNDENRVKPSGTTAMAIGPSDHLGSAISPSPVHLQTQRSATTDDVMAWLTMPPLETRPSSSSDGREAISLVSPTQLAPEENPTQENEESALQHSTSASIPLQNDYSDAESDSTKKMSNISNATLQVQPSRMHLTRQSSSKLSNIKLESQTETKSPSMDGKKNTLWTAKEEETLLKTYLHHRNDIKAVFQSVNGRSENACKNKLRDLHVVKEIIGHRPSSKKTGYWELKIRWLCWGAENDTWQPISQISEEEMSRLLVKDYINLHPDVGVGKVPREKVFNDVFQSGMSSTKKRKGSNAMFFYVDDCSSSEEDVITKKRSKHHHLDEKERARDFSNETSFTFWTKKEVEVLVLSHDNADSWKETMEAVSREGSERTVHACKTKFRSMTEDEKQEIRSRATNGSEGGIDRLDAAHCWTDEEDEALISSKDRGDPWEQISEAVSRVGAGRTTAACRSRYSRMAEDEKDDIRHPKTELSDEHENRWKLWTDVEIEALISSREKRDSWNVTCEAVSSVGAGRTINACVQKFYSLPKDTNEENGHLTTELLEQKSTTSEAGIKWTPKEVKVLVNSYEKSRSWDVASKAVTKVGIGRSSTAVSPDVTIDTAVLFLATYFFLQTLFCF